MDFSFDQVSAFSPSASTKATTGILIIVIYRNAKPEDIFDSPVKIEQSSCNWDKDEDGKEVIKALSQWSQNNESPEKLEKGCLAVDGLRQERDEIIREWYRELCNLLQVRPSMGRF